MKYKIAATYNDYISAHLALSQLESENIRCWLKDENTVTIDPILTNAVGGIKLMVAETQLERASQLLQTVKEDYQQQNPCPECGSTNVEYVSTPRKVSNWLGTIVSFALSIGSPTPIDKVYHCFSCGKEWTGEEE